MSVGIVNWERIRGSQFSSTRLIPPAAGSVDAAYGALGLSSTTSSGASTYFTRDPDGTLISERTPTGTYYYLFDGQGSVVGLTDAGGNLVNGYSYDPYGAVASSSESVPNPWRIAGAYLDTATGLYKIGARYYDPSAGRWTQWDPVLFALDPRGWNPYTFVGDDPVNFSDPTGLDDVGAWGSDYSWSDYFDWAGSCDCWSAGFVGDWPGDGGGGGGGNAGYAEIGWQAGNPSASDIVAGSSSWLDRRFGDGWHSSTGHHRRSSNSSGDLRHWVPYRGGRVRLDWP